MVSKAQIDRGKIVEFIRVHIEKDDSGLLIATSPDINGLYLTHRDEEFLRNEVPEALKALYLVEFDANVSVVEAQMPADVDGSYLALASIPAHIAASVAK